MNWHSPNEHETADHAHDLRKHEGERTMSNEARAERGFRLMQHYDGLHGVETGAPEDQHLTDMLADLRHWCEENAVDFDRANAMAQDHFRAEQAGE